MDFKVGDTVTTAIIQKEKDIARKVISIIQNDISGKKFLYVDGGGYCPSCHRSFGTPLGPHDASLFSLVPKQDVLC